MKEPPQILNAYHFCKEFGWAINEFYEQPYVDIQAFSIIMSEISRIERREMDRVKSKQQNRR